MISPLFQLVLKIAKKRKRGRAKRKGNEWMSRKAYFSEIFLSLISPVRFLLYKTMNMLSETETEENRVGLMGIGPTFRPMWSKTVRSAIRSAYTKTETYEHEY